MPRDTQGTYTLPAGTLVTAGDTVLVEQHNPSMSDIAQALTGSLARDGRGGMLGPLPMNGNPLTGLPAGVNPGDAATVAQLVATVGPPGPATNTYTSYAALIASDPSRKVANLVGDTDVPAHPDSAYAYGPAGWVAQLTPNLRGFGAIGNASSNDGATSQAAINATGGTGYLVGGNLAINRGQYATTAALSSSQFWLVQGSGTLSSFFVNTGASTVDLFDNGGFGYVDYQAFGARGYRSFLKSTAQVESITSSNLHIYASSGYAFDIAGNFLVLTLDKMTIDGAGVAGAAGFRVGGVFNNVALNSLQLLNLTDNNFDLAYSEGVLTTNMRAEGGNSTGKSLFKFAPTSHQHVLNVGGYIEGGPQNIVSGDGAGSTPWSGPGLLGFIGTHFTFWEANIQHVWAATSPIIACACDFAIPTRLPPQTQVLGYSQNLIRAEYVSHTPFVSKLRRPLSVNGTGPYVQSFLLISRADVTNTPTNTTTFAGVLMYAASWSNPDGGAAGSAVRKLDVLLSVTGGGNIQITVTPISGMDTGNAASVLTIAAAGSASNVNGVVIATWNGINPTSIANFDQQWSITWNQSAGLPTGTFAVSEPGA